MYAVLASTIPRYFSDRYLHFCVRFVPDHCCLAYEAEARHRYCFSGVVFNGVGGVTFFRVFWFSSVSQEL